MAELRRTQVMDWNKYTLDEWLAQYGAYISICRMRGGHEPDDLGINQIYWLIQENNSKPAKNKKTVLLTMSDFEFDEVRKLIHSIRITDRICHSGKVAIELYIQKQVRGLTLDQMDVEYKLSRSSINNMTYAGKYYLAGHDKRLVI
ncbi:hypothetical protein [Acinetobacter nectaris]|uniref:hypothetical protein n=1 Tax=Acinetobacter nectaris TaxID=1219382 RepID=UPI00301A3DB6